MSQKTRVQLKAFFETGDRPTQQQFADFIESVLNFSDDGNPSLSGFQYLGEAVIDLNSTENQLIELAKGASTKFIIQDILVTEFSINPNGIPAGEFYTEPDHGGYQFANFATPAIAIPVPDWVPEDLYVNSFTYNFLSGLKSVGNQIYLNLGVPQGMPATCRIKIYGYPL